MIRFSNVSKQYPNGATVLSGMDLQIDKGERVLLIGPSAAGKSTVLKLMGAFDTPTSGQVWVAGQNISAIEPARVPFFRRNLGLLFQQPRLLADQTILDNVMLPLAIAGYPMLEARGRARLALNTLGLFSKETRLPGTLSESEQQCVCAARAIVHQPPVLLADEPMRALDSRSKCLFLQLFESLSTTGTTLVLSACEALAFEAFSWRRVVLEAYPSLSGSPQSRTV